MKVTVGRTRMDVPGDTSGSRGDFADRVRTLNPDASERDVAVAVRALYTGLA